MCAAFVSFFRQVVVWFTLTSFLVVQTAAAADPHAEGTAAGQAANPVVRGTINTPNASSVVPGYTSTPPQRAYFGQPNLSGPANAQLANCVLTPNDPVCQALLGARTSANTPREAVSPYDPAVLAARRIAANPAATLEDIASYYSGCQVDTVSTPPTETRVCRQYSGATGQSCARTLSVSVTRTSSCSPGDWFAQASSGNTAMAVQCKPDLPASAQHFRVTSSGSPLVFFDVDMTTALVFPRMVAQLPNTGGWWGGGQNGFWVANNRCTGDSCRLTGFIAQEYRQICTGSGGDSGNYACTNERPFLEEYATCPAGTQSGDNISYTVGSGGDSGTSETLYLDKATCYAPTRQFSEYYGYDITGTVQGYYWTAQSNRPVVGFRLNPAYGSIPQMALAYERPHTTVTESDQWDDQCPSLEGDNRCAVTGAARCVDGPSTKEIDGAQVSRACWRYETALSCQYGAPTDECAPLATAGCTPTSSSCQQVNPATGACEITENRYTCPVAPSSTVTASNCPANVFCVAGSCFSTAYTNDADFARSMSFLEAAREAGVYLDTDNLQVFKGESNSCRDRLLKNCCASDSAGRGMTNQSMFGIGSRLVFDVLMNSGNREFLYQGMQALLLGGGFSGSFTTYGVTVAINGTALPAGSAVLYSGQSIVVAFDPWSLAIAVVIYAVMSMMSCNEEEGKLAMKEGARLCHTIGTYCSSCIRVFGHCVSCIEHTTGKCCFNSVLARLINEQGRQQVGKGWGSAQSPDCSGFTIAQLQTLNFAQMDLTEFYASIVPNLPNVGAIQGGNTVRASDCYYGQGRCQ
ncbi:type-F conjugative transfer system mating-pair stabilization protein TraN [Burkholderia vietnamiensis]|uniref:type-F conjugative transfer system mating-pair stabilization protein TraN n=1 Tax=Burkholderia vietnamiensis TaxID=60552 RepID=UPI001D1415B3|nr:type-F conjugative transfer system mating-pair stabilization protein TraN [Burkholderia vietnamiensis]UEC01783.1 type-F conjugative transfer system mating-pair stabilization protein TraN [Burkholderia vietnamiensis]